MRDIFSVLLVIVVWSTFSNIHVASRRKCKTVNGNTEGSVRVGTSFYTGFMRSFQASLGLPTLLISSQSANVNITVPYLSMFGEQHVVNGSKVITFPKDLKVETVETIKNKAVHITSDSPISVYSINVETPGTADGGCVYPDEFLGTEYIIAGAPVYSVLYGKDQFLIIGIEDDTSVTMEFPDGSQNTILMDRMTTYIRLGEELSGTIINATKPIAVKSGHTCFVIDSVCDLLSEQMPPIHSLGVVHVTGYMKPRPNYFIQILSPFNQTNVYVYDRNGAQLDAFLGMSRASRKVRFYSVAAVSVIATRPVLVVQYGDDNDGAGDGSLMQVMSIDHFRPEYDFTVPPFNYESIIMIVISSDFDTTGFLLDGAPLLVTENVSVTVPDNGTYEIIYANVNSQDHYILSHSGGKNVIFGVWLYGRDNVLFVPSEYAWPLFSFFKNQF